MTQSINIGRVNANTQTGSTTTYFNNIAYPAIHTSQNIDDAVIGFFEQIARTKDSARAIAGAVILTAKSQGYDPMIILAEFAKVKVGDLTAYTAMFLNLSRKGTSYLGINNNPSSPKYIVRLIKA